MTKQLMAIITLLSVLFGIAMFIFNFLKKKKEETEMKKIYDENDNPVEDEEEEFEKEFNEHINEEEDDYEDDEWDDDVAEPNVDEILKEEDYKDWEKDEENQFGFGGE